MGFRIWNSQGYCEIAFEEFAGVNYKQRGISTTDQEKIKWNFQGSWF